MSLWQQYFSNKISQTQLPGTPPYYIPHQSGPLPFDTLSPRPVGKLANDEEVLLNALCAGRLKGFSANEALNEIHKVIIFVLQ